LWKIIKSTGAGRTALNYFLVGFIMGLAFSIRFQTIIFIGGVGLAILLEKKWKEAVFFGLGTLFSMSLIQGVIDIFIWGRPFAELTEYILYNLAHSDDYGTRNFWMYFQTIPAMLIPPVGILLFFGFFMQWRKHLLIFVPTFLFFMFHTVFPNKQERFIFTVIPMFVILGTIGWMSFTSTSRFWIKNSKLLNAGYLFSLLINIMLLSVLTVSYSKKARVEASLYLSRYENLRSIVIEETSRSSAQMIPVFYMNNWITVYVLGNPPYARDHHPSEISPTGRIFREIYSIHFFDHQPQERQPQFVIFVGDKDIDYRISAAKRVFPHLINETSFEPGFVDRIMHRLTPANNNQTLYLYRTRIGDYTLKE
ncbi:MAG: hypothetical protein Q8M23_10190, partial [Bacteroidales bacterium]|nr:hypothetical protein [Bacteroidales bacterium]